MTSIEQQIDDLFAVPADRRVTAVTDSVSRRIDASGGTILLFGAGHYGHVATAALRKMGQNPAAFVDNNHRKHGTDIDGVPIIAPADILSRFGSKALIVVTVYNSTPILRQLNAMGLEGVTYAQLAWTLAEPFVPYCGVCFPHSLWEHLDQIKIVANRWADDKSRQEYLGQLRWSLTLDPFALPPHDDPAETYFDRDIIHWGNEEVFVDCGAFDGDSVEAFTERCPNYKSAFGIEPDPINRATFVKRFGSEATMSDKRIRLLPYAVGAKKELLSFAATGTAGSAISRGGITVEAVTLDSLANEFVPTFLKMDIEGAEPYALEGAAKILHRHAPSLAVCLYHNQDHLWQLPSLIHATQPKYDLYLRHYADECWETVCYAVARNHSPRDSKA